MVSFLKGMSIREFKFGVPKHSDFEPDSFLVKGNGNVTAKCALIALDLVKPAIPCGDHLSHDVLEPGWIRVSRRRELQAEEDHANHYPDPFRLPSQNHSLTHSRVYIRKI
jgi:hypothetical protein